MSFVFSNFPSFQNIGPGLNGMNNVYPPNRVIGEGNELATIDRQEKPGQVGYAMLKYDCYPYPKIDLSDIPNESQKIRTINKLKPVHGDLIFGMHEDYLHQTHYEYNGFSMQQINLILQYEEETAIAYLMNIFGNEEKSKNIIDKLIQIYVDKNIYGILTKKIYRVISNDEINEDIHLKIELFLRFCKETGLIKAYLDKIIKNMDKEWDNVVTAFRLDTQFIIEFTDMNIQLLSCFSCSAINERIKYLGVCIRSNDIVNTDVTIPFRRLEVAYFGHVLFYPLHHLVRKNSKFNLYWIRRGIERVRLTIFPSYIRTSDIKAIVKPLTDNILIRDRDDITGCGIEIIRGTYIGELKDHKSVPGYRKSLYYKMQAFPHKKINNSKYSPEDVFDFIHKRQEKRKLWIENIRS